MTNSKQDLFLPAAASLATTHATQPVVTAPVADPTADAGHHSTSVNPYTEVEVTGLLLAMDLLRCGEVLTPSRMTGAVRHTLRDPRGRLSDDQQTVQWTCKMWVPTKSGTDAVQSEELTWTTPNRTLDAAQTRSADRRVELVRLVLREGLTPAAAASHLGISAGTALNLLAVPLERLMPNIHARSAILATPNRAAKRVVADLIEGKPVAESATDVALAMTGYCSPVDDRSVSAAWVARGHGWRRELHAYLIAAGEPVTWTSCATPSSPNP
jgi:hypothetical protein